MLLELQCERFLVSAWQGIGSCGDLLVLNSEPGQQLLLHGWRLQLVLSFRSLLLDDELVQGSRKLELLRSARSSRPLVKPERHGTARQRRADCGADRLSQSAYDRGRMVRAAGDA